MRSYLVYLTLNIIFSVVSVVVGSPRSLLYTQPIPVETGRSVSYVPTWWDVTAWPDLVRRLDVRRLRDARYIYVAAWWPYFVPGRSHGAY
jgi:hypothetical protein